MARLNIFASFEFDKDHNLKNSFLEQARTQTHHRIKNCSLNEAYPDDKWKRKARQAVGECDVVFVLVGQDTHNAPGVLVETDMARSLKKPTIQVLSAKARSNNYTGLRHLKDRIPWKWQVINRRLDEL